MNCITLTGSIYAEPEIRTSQNGKEYALMTLRVKRDRKESDGSYKSDFFDCLAGGNTVNFIKSYIKKDSSVGIVGKVEINSYTKSDGTKGKSTRIMIDKIEFVGFKSDSNEEKIEKKEEPKEDKVAKQVDEFANEIDISDEDLPF